MEETKKLSVIEQQTQAAQLEAAQTALETAKMDRNSSRLNSKPRN